MHMRFRVFELFRPVAAGKHRHRVTTSSKGIHYFLAQLFPTSQFNWRVEIGQKQYAHLLFLMQHALEARD